MHTHANGTDNKVFIEFDLTFIRIAQKIYNSSPCAVVDERGHVMVFSGGGEKR
jgi:hypothetical protein